MGLFDDLILKLTEPEHIELAKKAKAERDDLDSKFQLADGYVRRWEEWKANEWDDDSKMTRRALEEIQERDRKIAEYEAKQGTEMNWDEIKSKLDEDIKARGYVSQADLKDDKRLAELGLVKRDAVDNLGYGMQSYYAKTAPLLTAHVREFGEDLNMEDFQKYMSSPAAPKDDKGVWDFKKGYDEFVAPKRATKAAEASVKREEEIRKDEREKTLKEAAMSAGGRIPTDQTGSGGDLGWMQRQKMAKLKGDSDKLPKLAEGQLGTGASGQLAYEAWVASQTNRVQ